MRLDDVSSLRAWLVTTDPSTACEVLDPLQERRAELGRCATASATGLVAFEITSATAPVRRTFALNLAVAQLPIDRDAQVVRMVVDNQDRFFAYLLALLGGLDAGVLPGPGPGDERRGAKGFGFGPMHGLLEQLVRARARDPRRLDELRAFVDSLASTEQGRAIVPAEFLEVWAVVGSEVTT
jgi:hypothetical protein